MKKAVALTVCAMVLAGCAGGPPAPPVAPNASPEQVLLALNARAMTVPSRPDPIFGLLQIKELVQPAIARCSMEGGTLTILARNEVRFAPKVPGVSAAQSASLYLPTKMGCRASGIYAWGGTIAYDNALFFYSTWAEQMNYYFTTRTSFIAGAALEWTEPDSAGNKRANAKVYEDCAARREAQTNVLRTKPEVGMKAGAGLIIDVRIPLALVQYSTLMQQVRGRTQEWVPASNLISGIECAR